jgi:hypothetical protein
MNSIAKGCSQISRLIGGAQLDLDQRQEIDGSVIVFSLTRMDEPSSRPAHTENSAIAGSWLEKTPQIAMRQVQLSVSYIVGWSSATSRPLRYAIGLLLPDDGAECNRRADPPQGHASDPDDVRRMRRLDARAAG